MRTVRRLLTLALAASALLIPGAGLAVAAEPYPIVTPDLGVSAATTIVGDTVQLNGVGYGPGETVDIAVAYTPGAMGRLGRSVAGQVGDATAQRAQQLVVADLNGSFSAPVSLTQVGIAIITATGLTTGISLSVRVTVLPVGGALPVTGNDGSLLWVSLIGAAVLAVGIVTLVMTRSRRRSTRMEQ